MMKPTISNHSIVVAAENQVSADLADEVVVLTLNSGEFYGFSGVSSRIWELIQEPRCFDDILKTILEEYEVEPERCERDLLKFLHELTTHELIEIVDETNT